MTLIALRAFYDAATGRVAEGEPFDANLRTAQQLIRRGIAYETKVTRPEVQTLPAAPFRELPVPDDPEPPALAAVRAATVAAADVSTQRDARGGKRGRGKRAG